LYGERRRLQARPRRGVCEADAGGTHRLRSPHRQWLDWPPLRHADPAEGRRTRQVIRAAMIRRSPLGANQPAFQVVSAANRHSNRSCRARLTRAESMSLSTIIQAIRPCDNNQRCVQTRVTCRIVRPSPAASNKRGPCTRTWPSRSERERPGKGAVVPTASPLRAV
jgi:hypothetical protein